MDIVTYEHPIGKYFASKVDDEKTAFADGTASERNKNPAISIIG